MKSALREGGLYLAMQGEFLWLKRSLLVLPQGYSLIFSLSRCCLQIVPIQSVLEERVTTCHNSQ